MKKVNINFQNFKRKNKQWTTTTGKTSSSIQKQIKNLKQKFLFIEVIPNIVSM